MLNINFSRNLFSGGRGLRIKSFMRAPTIYRGGNTLNVSAFPIVMFNYEPPSGQYPFGEKPKDTFFKMNQRNQRKVTSFFRTILTWFESDLYKDLFILDEREGKLMVNMDFRDLKASVGSNSRYETQMMLALPAVITQDSVQNEGCALAINRTNYTCALTDSEIESILGILENFSFQQEAQLMLDLACHKELYTTEPPRYGGNGSSHKVEW